MISVASFIGYGRRGRSIHNAAATYPEAPLPRLDLDKPASTARTTRLQGNPVGHDMIGVRLLRRIGLKAARPYDGAASITLRLSGEARSLFAKSMWFKFE